MERIFQNNTWTIFTVKQFLICIMLSPAKTSQLIQVLYEHFKNRENVLIIAFEYYTYYNNIRN